MEEKKSRAGQIKESKTRYNISMEKELKKRLENIAYNQDRSLNGLINRVLRLYADEAESSDKYDNY